MSDGFERSSGNVFADVGHPEADTALAKATLILRIKAAIKGRGWTREQAAIELGIGHDRVVALTRGRLSEFSTDDLIDLLKQLNIDVDINIGPNTSTSRAARVVVHSHAEPIAAGPAPVSSESIRFK